MVVVSHALDVGVVAHREIARQPALLTRPERRDRTPQRIRVPLHTGDTEQHETFKRADDRRVTAAGQRLVERTSTRTDRVAFSLNGRAFRPS